MFHWKNKLKNYAKIFDEALDFVIKEENEEIDVTLTITNSNDVLNRDFNDWYFYLYPNFYRDSSVHMIYDEASFEEYVISADSQEEAAAWMAENFEGMTITSLE